MADVMKVLGKPASSMAKASSSTDKAFGRSVSGAKAKESGGTTIMATA